LEIFADLHLLKGRLDRGNQATFIQQAEQALATTPWLVLNLAQTEFLDSSALGPS